MQGGHAAAHTAGGVSGAGRFAYGLIDCQLSHRLRIELDSWPKAPLRSGHDPLDGSDRAKQRTKRSPPHIDSAYRHALQRSKCANGL